jgi:hypothetical protein
MAKRTKQKRKLSSATGEAGKRASGKRELTKPKGDARFIRRDEKGRIRESDDMGRSLKSDRVRRAKRTVKSGYGDR